MGRFIIRRLLGGIIVLLIVTFVSYLMFFKIPAHPEVLYAGRTSSAATIAATKIRLGLDAPWYDQYWQFLHGIFAGRTYGHGADAIPCPKPCLGYSFKNNLPVTKLLLNRLPVTVSLAIGAAVIWLIMGLLTGILSALKRGSLIDRGVMSVALLGVSLPPYFTGLLALFVIVYSLGVLPEPSYTSFSTNPLQWATGLIIPWVVLAFLQAAIYARLSRANMLETMSEDFIRTARAKGLPERQVVLKHGLRAALTPILTVFGLDLGTLLGGAILTEQVFSLQGIGKLSLDAIGDSDLPVVIGVVLVASFFVVIANLVVDVLYGAVDPRVRLS